MGATRRSAGLLVFRRRDGVLEVFLAHPGGPFWARKDDGAWTIPKGELNEGEDPLACARREFAEEIGQTVDGRFQPLAPIRQKGGKLVQAWAVEADVDPGKIRSNHFTCEWPPRSGQVRSFPEVDRAGWFALPAARVKLLASQQPLLDDLEQRLRTAGTGSSG